MLDGTMDLDCSATGLARALRDYLDGALTLDALDEYLSACEAAVRDGAADRALSRALATALLVIMEQREGVRPPADVRSTLLALEGSLTGAPAPRPTSARAPIPRPKGRPPRPRPRRRA